RRPRSDDRGPTSENASPQAGVFLYLTSNLGPRTSDPGPRTSELPMPRSIWKGSLAFGLVNIPIELYSATRDHRPKFRLLHAEDEAPVRYERVCQSEGKPVAWEDLVKGYEYEKGHFVVLTKDDFKTAAVEKTKT